ncbi:hypothetical protein BVC80_9081g46 [Macleaya cordata]|uniref:Endonuclease/exonuclease/phosphatase n=1 Tax=Macleaya cordata TaxID=56857 RepID=A0A200PRN1_MACCD|nr:hypothetical protein BVC80_9081g46 [Macleaya cordata]
MKERLTGIAIQETKMLKVSEWFVKSLWGSDSFDWINIPSNGRSGGLLLIWDDSLLIKERDFIGKHSLSVEVSTVGDDFKWVWSSAYAPNSPAEKKVFWEELELIKVWSQAPLCLAADFNAMRSDKERNKPGGCRVNRSALNNLISRCTLIDLPMAGGRIWWSNLLYEGRPSYVLAKKLLDLKFMIKQWSKEMYGDSRNKLAALKDLIENLDCKEEGGNLSAQELNSREMARKDLNTLMLNRERRIRQRAKVTKEKPLEAIERRVLGEAVLIARAF